jgi:hypothetical protein
MSDNGSVMDTEVAGGLEPGMAFGVTRARTSGLPKEDRLATSTMVDRIVPLEAEPLAAPDSVLLRAAEIVRERGLCQGPWRAGGRLCAAGAVGEAAKELGLTRREMEFCLLQFAGVLGGALVRDVHRWNDADGRTADEVADALERAAYGV